MTQNYESLLQDLLLAKKDLNQFKVRNSQLESELKYAREEINELRNQSDKLVREKHSLEAKVRSLQGQLEQLRISYEATVHSMKADVDSRQNEIQSVRDQLNPHLDFQMMRMKILGELQDQYGKKLEEREEQLERARNSADESIREKELLEEKLKFQERQTSASINEMRQQHIEELQNLTRTITRMKGANQPEDTLKELNRKLRRDNEEMRTLLIQKNREVEELRQEQSRLKNESSGNAVAHSKLVERLRDEVRIHRQEADRLQRQLVNSTADRDRFLLAQKEKELRKLQTDIEDMYEQLRSKDGKINRLNETIAELEVDVARANSKQQLNEERQTLQITRHSLQQLQKEHRQLQQRLEDAKRINEHQQEKQEQYRKEIKDFKEVANRNRQAARAPRLDVADTRNINITNYESTKDVSNQHSLERQDGLFNNSRTREVEILNSELTKQIESLSADLEKTRKQTADLRKKYDAAKEKLKQANAKIMELLQFKIRTSNSPDSFKLPTLLSPAPTIKKVFNFTSEDKTLGSPQNLPARDSIAEDHRKQFLSPQNPSYAAGRTQQVSGGASGMARASDDFYEKSKSFRANKGVVVCIHHDRPK